MKENPGQVYFGLRMLSTYNYDTNQRMFFLALRQITLEETTEEMYQCAEQRSKFEIFLRVYNHLLLKKHLGSSN